MKELTLKSSAEDTDFIYHPWNSACQIHNLGFYAVN